MEGLEMDEFKKQILKEGKIVSDHVLNLDSLLNHQVDPSQMIEIGKRFASMFKNDRITKVLTIESSGISVGFCTALALGVPLVFARRRKTLTTDQDAYCERVPSFTKGIVTDIMVSREFLKTEDRILIIDDIIANGDAVRGLIKIIHQSGAELIGLGVVIEKRFQTGGESIREQGIRVESLVKIKSLAQGKIVLE